MAHYILADNQELTRFALESIIRRDERNTIYRASEKAQLLEHLKSHENSIVILDYALYDFPNEDSLLVLSERFAMTTWVLMSEDLTPAFLRKIIYSSHSFSVVFKDSPLNDIREAIKYATEGERYIDQHATNILFTKQEEEDKPLLLTSTEIEIVKSIAQGKTTKDIAAERFSSIHTINTHRKNIFRKLGVNTAHEVMKYALRSGLLDTSDLYYI